MNDTIAEILRKNGYRIAHNITLRTWKKDDLIERIRNLENNWAVALEMNENQFELLIKKDLEAEKYRWHDLRADDMDLPEYDVDVEVVNDEGIHGIARWTQEDVYTPKGDCCKFTEWRNKYCLYDDDAWDSDENGYIIAWRNIEPFEEVEQDNDRTFCCNINK